MKEKSVHEKIAWLVTVGLLAALVVVGSWLRITIPTVLGVSAFHLGNIMCALSGMLLGPAGGALAAGLGSAIYDMTNPLYISECWITFLQKGAYGLVVGLIAWSGERRGRSGRRNLMAVTAGAATYAVLYLLKQVFWSGMLVKGLPLNGAVVAATAKVPATVFNAVVAVVCAPALCAAIQKARARLPRAA